MIFSDKNKKFWPLCITITTTSLLFKYRYTLKKYIAFKYVCKCTIYQQRNWKAKNPPKNLENVFLWHILENWSFTTFFEKEMKTFLSHYDVIFRTNNSSCCVEQERIKKTITLSAFLALSMDVNEKVKQLSCSLK